MPSVWLGNYKYNILSYWFDLIRVGICVFDSNDLQKWETDAELIQQSHLVHLLVKSRDGLKSRAPNSLSADRMFDLQLN